MDILNKLMAGQSEELMSALKGSGFSLEQAKEFLPVASEGIGEALGKSDVTALLEQGSDPVAGILGQIDLAGMAAKLGLDASMVSNGLQAILPHLLSALQGGGGGLGSLLGGLGGGSGGGLGGLLKRGSDFLK